MAFPVAHGGASSVAASARVAPRVARANSSVRGFGLAKKTARIADRRASFAAPARAAAEEPAETDEQREARIQAEAVHLVEYRLLKILPAELLNSISIPPKLTEIRSYVRWEEAGKPQDTSREWQVREYQAALVDLKLEMLAGGNLNDVRRRYQLDTEFGEDAPLHVPSKEQLELLRAAAAVTKEKEYYDPAKIDAIKAEEAAELAARVDVAGKIAAAREAEEAAIAEAQAKLRADAEARLAALEAEAVKAAAEAEAADKKAKAQAEAEKAEKTESEADSKADPEAVKALELAFETDVSDIGAKDAELAVEAEDDLAARIAAAAELAVVAAAAAPAPEPAKPPAAADASEGEFGDDELALLKERIAEEAAVAMEKARVKAAAAKKARMQAEALAVRQAAKRTKEIKADVDATKAAAEAAAVAESPASSKAKALAAAKAKAEAQLKLAREEMEAAKKALASASAKKTGEKTEVPVAPKMASPEAAPKMASPEAAPKMASPEAAPKIAAPEAAPAPVKSASPKSTEYGTKRTATELEAKEKAKVAAAEQRARDAERNALAERRAQAAAEKEAAEAVVAAAEDAKAAERANAEEVNALVAAKVAKLEELHALAIETLKGEHRAALIAARAEAAGEAAADASPTEKQLREKLSEAVGALEVSNKQCKSLKAKLAESREELEKVKRITAKAAEVLESRSADQRLIKSLKKELDIAVELEEAAERRATYAEKEAAKLKSRSLREGDAAEVAKLKSELADAVEVIAEFKASWEADRKVIALLSKMQAAPEDAQAAADATAAAKASEKKSEGLWDLAKKYGKKTLTFLGESAEKEREDVAAAKLRASAAKRNNAYGLEYNRAGGSATVAKLRANKENGDAPVDERARVRQLNWLAAAEEATEAAAMFEEKKPEAKTAAKNEPEPAPAPAPVTPAASNNAVPVRKAPATTAERVAAAVAAAKPPPSEAAAAVPPPPVTPPPASARRSPTAPLDISAPAIGSPPAVASNAAVAAPGSAAPAAREPFTPSIVFPKSDGDDDKPKSSGWSSAHMPPGR